MRKISRKRKIICCQVLCNPISLLTCIDFWIGFCYQFLLV
uniref:Uncharacterized protein n=1 Tax=Rhizophora mucronata TaxID=61149 RepID=A0A2P2J7H0_RHIMU